jgi:hypothetical protein
MISKCKQNEFFFTCGFVFGEPFGVHVAIKIKIIYMK